MSNLFSRCNIPILIGLTMLMPTNILSQSTIEKEFETIIMLSDHEKRMVNTNEPYTYDNYATFALLASGVQQKEMTRFKRSIDSITRDLSVALETQKVSSQTIERAEFILHWLHSRFFRSYKAKQTRLDTSLQNRDFNCVSSSVLYAIVCRKFAINITGVIVKDHAFSQLKLPTKKIDVETTIKYGFDPSTRKDILDQFGQLTGFAYVPQRNYQARSEISDKQMISLIYSNRYKTLSDQNRHAEAARALHLGWHLAGDLPRNTNSWESGLSNYIISLDHAKRYSDALFVIEKSLDLFPYMKQPRQLRYNVYVNWSYHLLKSNQFMQGIQVVETGLQEYPKDRRLEQNLRAAYIDQIQLAVRNGQFKKAKQSITKAKSALPKEETFDQLSVNVIVESTKGLSVEESVPIFRKALRGKPNDKILLEAFAFVYIDPAQKLANQRQFFKAIKLLERGEEVLPGLHQLLKAKTLVYNNWALELAKLQKFESAVKIIENGVSIKPTDKTLLNNWDAIMLDWANFCFKKNQSDQAGQIIVKGINRSKRNRRKFENIAEAYYNNQAVRSLNSGKTKEGIQYLESGLKLIPKSSVLRRNLNLARQKKGDN